MTSGGPRTGGWPRASRTHRRSGGRDCRWCRRLRWFERDSRLVCWCVRGDRRVGCGGGDGRLNWLGWCRRDTGLVGDCTRSKRPEGSDVRDGRRDGCGRSSTEDNRRRGSGLQSQWIGSSRLTLLPCCLDPSPPVPPAELDGADCGLASRGLIVLPCRAAMRNAMA